ncbi:MAG: hypothetical protein HZB53_13995 [Chloroflexi bacterium]|nr:hypothetical protein [Chloroflexota bacterium]
MTSTTLNATRSVVSAKWLVPGLGASLVMGMWEMMIEAVVGAGFWAPVVFIAATVVRNLQGVAVPVPFDLVAVVAGLMGHMMNSVIFGLIFTFFIAPRARARGGQITAGMVYGAVIFALMWFIVAPLADPVMLKLNAAVFFLGHLMWGAVLGLLNHQIAAAH